MNVLDAIVTLTIDGMPCHRSETLRELCQTHGAEMYGAECEIVAEKRRHLTSALSELTPVMVDWLAGMIDGAANDMSGEVDHKVQAGYHGAAALLRRWDPWVEFEDDA